MKQILYGVVATIFTIAPLTAGAQVATPTAFTVPVTAGGLKNESIFSLFTTVMNWLLGLIGVLAVIAFVISGVMYLTSAGDEKQIEKAKSIMMYAIIGLVVALVGLIIVNAIAGLTGAGSVTTY